MVVSQNISIETRKVIPVFRLVTPAMEPYISSLKQSLARGVCILYSFTLAPTCIYMPAISDSSRPVSPASQPLAPPDAGSLPLLPHGQQPRINL